MMAGITIVAQDNDAATRIASPDETLNVTKTKLQIGIVPEGYPKYWLTKEQQNALEDKLVDLVVQQGGGLKPKFTGSHMKVGYLILYCVDEATAEWVKSNAEQLHLADLLVSVSFVKDIPRLYKITGIFPDSSLYTDEKIVALINNQNNDLQADRWKIQQRTEARDSNNSVELTFFVDLVSFLALKSTHFCIHYRLGSVELIGPKRQGLIKIKKKRGICGTRRDSECSESYQSLRDPPYRCSPSISRQNYRSSRSSVNRCSPPGGANERALNCSPRADSAFPAVAPYRCNAQSRNYRNRSRTPDKYKAKSWHSTFRSGHYVIASHSRLQKSSHIDY